MTDRKTLLAHKALRLVFGFLVRLLMRVDARGLERTPKEGPLLITANHSSIFEGPIVFASLPRSPMSLLAKKEWKGSPIGKLMDLLDAIYVSRGEVDRQALKEMLRRLKQGEAFGIAPEGTRSETGTLIQGKEGAAYLARQSEAWVLPVAVWGHKDAVAQWKRLRRPRVFLRVGEPFKLTDDPTLSRQENLEAGTRRIMHAIARLLPPDYRGYYADEVQGEPHW